jgi:hypothetical protein
MRKWLSGFSLLSISVFLYACASSTPPSRIADYVPMGEQARGDLFAVGQHPLQAVLILVSDTAAPDSAPNLPDEAMIRLGEELKRAISDALPVTIKEVIPADDVRILGGEVQIAEVAKQHGVDYAAVVVMSSTEQEYPMTVFLGWHSHMQPGFRRDNWSLLEFAFLDAKDGKVLLHEEARGWATLDRPTAPGIDQWYPVVFMRPQDPPERFIWPPTYEGAPFTLRVVSFNQAAQRLSRKLEKSWLG